MSEKKCCECQCECHKKGDSCAVWAFLFALTVVLFFLWVVNSASKPQKPKRVPPTAEQILAQEARSEELRQKQYILGQQGEKPRFQPELVEALRLRCLSKGYQFKRVDIYRRWSREPLAVCLANPGLKEQKIVTLSRDD